VNTTTLSARNTASSTLCVMNSTVFFFFSQIFSDDIGVSYNISSQSIQDWDGEWVSDPNIELATALEYAKVQYDLGYTDKLLTQDDLFDLSFYNKVMAEMGEE